MSKIQFQDTSSREWKEKEDLLREHYPTMAWDELVALIGKSKSAISNKAHLMGLVRTAQFIRHEGQNFTINKPHVVASKQTAPVNHENSFICNGTAKGNYNGSELQPFSGRPGAMDAYTLPSRTFNERKYRDGRTEPV